MSNQRRPNALLELEWLALHWHGLRELKQHRTNRWQLSWSYQQNDILSTSGQRNCQQNTDVDPTNNCYLRGFRVHENM